MSDELRKEAVDILDDFLFGNVFNNHNRHEDDWAITFVGDDYVLRHYETGRVFNLSVSIGPGTLSKEEIIQAGVDQEWWDEDDEITLVETLDSE